MAQNLSNIRRDVIVFLAIFVICLCAFGETLSHPFMMDDKVVLGQGARGLSVESVVACFNPQHGALVYYRPVANLAHLLLYHWSAGQAFYYRLANIFLFTVLLGVVYFFTRRLFKDKRAALLTVLFFCLHPINGFYVNYITCHAVLLWGILMFAALYTHLCFIDGNRRIAWLWVSVFLYFGALGTQEMSVVLPMYIFLLNLFRQASWAEAFKRSLPYVVLTVVWIVLRIMFFSSGHNVLGMIAHGAGWMGLHAGNYFPSLLILIGWYIQQLIVPTQVLFMKSFGPVHGNECLINAVVVLILGVVVFVIRGIPSRLVKWSSIWLLAGFLPLGYAALIYPAQGLTIEPHWMMVGSLGFFWIVALLAVEWQKHVRYFVWVIAFLLVVTTLAMYTKTYNALWRSQKSYCEYWLSIEPWHQLPNFWLGYDYAQKGNLPLAKYFFKRSLTGWYIDWEVFVNLGVIARREGKLDEALQWDRKALALNPTFTEALHDLNVLAAIRGQHP